MNPPAPSGRVLGRTPGRIGRVVVAGLGPAGPELVTAAVTDAVARIPHRFLRTSRHPAAVVVEQAGAVSFDGVYDESGTFDEVYATIVARLVDAAAEHGEVLYAVPGSPSVAERTVELLRAAAADGRVALTVLPSLSFLDLAWDRLGIDPLDAGVRMVDGTRFAAEAAGERGPLLVAQCFSQSVLSDVKLALEDAEGPRVTVLQRLGLPDEAVFEVEWDELDRAVHADHLTSVYVPEFAAPVAGELVRLTELMRTLRAGCPWDAEQTHASLARYAVEEAYELAEAIDQMDTDPDGDGGLDHLVEELGDVLFQVVFHAAIGAEEGWFTLADVARAVHDKLVHRHPHVFPRESFDASDVASPDDVVRNWEQIKGGSSIPETLPALLYASKVVKRAEAAGLPVPAAAAAPDDAAALGELLLGVVAAARKAGLDPEVALRTAAARLRDRLPR